MSTYESGPGAHKNCYSDIEAFRVLCRSQIAEYRADISRLSLEWGLTTRSGFWVSIHWAWTGGGDESLPPLWTCCRGGAAMCRAAAAAAAAAETGRAEWRRTAPLSLSSQAGDRRLET
jgi:hypothetical protein